MGTTDNIVMENKGNKYRKRGGILKLLVLAASGLFLFAFCGHLHRLFNFSIKGILFNDQLLSHNEVIVNPFEWKKIVPSPNLEWHSCGKDRDCARFEVPMDHTDPDGEKVAIALKRVNTKVCRGSRKYRGPILFNPGGPGASGVDFIDTIGDDMQKLYDYDLIGFDPRGIGRTTPAVNIFPDVFERAHWEYIPPPILISEHPDALEDLYARSVLTGKLVSSRSKRAAEYVSTAMVARDMLMITRAHGYEKLKYWGFSYGTILGATYAAMFPNNVERLVIDGVVEFSDYIGGYWFSNLEDTDKVLTYFATECAASNSSCPLHAPTPALVSARIQKIYDTIKAAPLPVLGTNSQFGVISSSVLKSSWLLALYSPFAALKVFITAMAALEYGDGVPMLDFYIRVWYSLVDLQPKCPSVPTATMFKKEAYNAVICGEGLEAPRSLEAFRNYTEELGKIPMFNDIWAQITRLSCLGWDITAKEIFTGPFTGNTCFPLLIIGNTMDPVTPLMAAKKASEGFAGSVLLTVNTPGHCSLAGTSLTASKHIRNYFRNGILPPKDTVCEIEDKLFEVSGQEAKDKDMTSALSVEDKELLDAARSLSKNFRMGGLRLL